MKTSNGISAMLVWKDNDYDSLEIKEVFGFTEPMLLIRVIQEGNESQMNLTTNQAFEVVEFLNKWIESTEAR